jgi:hypothetical protein
LGTLKGKTTMSIHSERSSRFLIAFFLSLFAAELLQAQVGAGSIQGTVSDPSGAIVPNARITAEHVETANAFHTVSNSAGFFIFPSAQPGKYRVTVESPGLEKWVGELTLETGQEVVVTPQLKVGGVAAQVTVAGDVTPLVTTTSPTLSSEVERERIEELPLNGRFLQNLIQMTTPGLETGVSGATSPQAFGLRDGSVQFLQDGVPISDANIRLTRQTASGIGHHSGVPAGDERVFG